jgi:hypothetical protein
MVEGKNKEGLKSLYLDNKTIMGFLKGCQNKARIFFSFFFKEKKEKKEKNYFTFLFDL